MADDLDGAIAGITNQTDRPVKGTLRAGFFGRDKVGSSMSRADIATFLVRQFTDDAYRPAAPRSATDDPAPSTKGTPMTPAHAPQPTQRLHDGTAAGTWTLDPAASSITVAVKHFWGLITVRGTFTDADGHADVSDDGTVTASLAVDAASINTKNKKRDHHLRSDEFFNVENHPTITFTANDVTVVDETTVRVSGVVTAGGAEQTTTFDATLAADNDRATVAAEVVIDHKALGMTWSPLGMTKPTTLLTLALTYTRT